MTDSARPRAPLATPTRLDRAGNQRSYVRFAALGDSVTHGIGDPLGDGCRGWARVLAGALQHEHDVSFCNLARPGATIGDMRYEQLSDALEHRPHLASLIVGINDTMRSSWDLQRARADLLSSARQLSDQGVLLMTVRFHDHSQVLRLPRLLARPMQRRIASLNEVYDEIHESFDGIQVNLSEHPGVYDREFWSIDRVHPAELGHRALAEEFAALLEDRGLNFAGPGLDLDGLNITRWQELRSLVGEGVPWLGRRVRDLAPTAATAFVSSLKGRQTG